MRWRDCRLLTGLLVAAIMLAGGPVRADSETAAWAALHESGHVAFLRHAKAPGVADAADMHVDDCTTQRNLDREGQKQAEAIGERLRAHGVERRTVYTSRMCRARETAARIRIGPVHAFAGLDSYFGDDAYKAVVLRKLRGFLESIEADWPPILVTHTPNIHEITGERPVEGGMVVARIHADGRIETIGMIPPPAL